jgi:putative transposase
MDDYESLSHSKWECKNHVVFIPKYRRKALYGQLRRHLGEVFRRLAEQKQSRVVEGHLMSDHVRMMLSIPPKYAVSQVIGHINDKSAIDLERVYGERKRNFVGQHFWARGYFVSTVGRDEALNREYIRQQEDEDKRLDQLTLRRRAAAFRQRPRIGVALATPQPAALSGSQSKSKAPGFAGGYFLYLYEATDMLLSQVEARTSGRLRHTANEAAVHAAGERLRIDVDDTHGLGARPQCGGQRRKVEKDGRDV